MTIYIYILQMIDNFHGSHDVFNIHRRWSDVFFFYTLMVGLKPDPWIMWSNQRTEKVAWLLCEAAPIPNSVFKPVSHWVGHQKDGVITQATDG